MHRMFTLLILLALGLALVPSATAHATYSSDDGQYRITVGYKGEPVYTYQSTGLELIIRDNATGDGVEGVHETLEATLVSPSGAELSHALEPQHGETSRYQFTDGFVLTEPGLYKLRLTGDINGSPVDRDYAMAHATKPRTEIMFPADGLADVEALNDQIADLQSRLDALEAERQDAGTQSTGENAESPAPVVPLVLLGALLVAFVARRR